jgi:hypothetical protein
MRGAYARATYSRSFLLIASIVRLICPLTRVTAVTSCVWALMIAFGLPLANALLALSISLP